MSYHHNIIGYRILRYPIIEFLFSELKYKVGRESVYIMFYLLINTTSLDSI